MNRRNKIMLLSMLVIALLPSAMLPIPITEDEKEAYARCLNLYKDRKYDEALAGLESVSQWDTLFHDYTMLRCYCLLKTGRTSDLTDAYLGALRKGIADEDIKDFYMDMRDIVPRDKQKQLNDLSGAELSAALIAFWVARDPDPFTHENEFLTEFFRRLEYVREHYKVNDKIGYDDRGKMYLKHGEPTDKVILPGGLTDAVANESWLYMTSSGRHIYHFVDKFMMGRFYLEQDLGIARRHGWGNEILERRGELDPIYDRIVRSLENDTVEVTPDIQQELLDRIADITIAETANEPFNPPRLVDIQSSQHFYFDLFQYQSIASPTQIDLNIIVAFPAEARDFYQSEGESETRIETGAIFYNEEWQEVSRYDKFKQFRFAAPPQKSQYLLHGFWVTIPPGRYHFSLKAITAGSGRGQIYRMGLAVDSLGVERLAMSDIQIGSKVSDLLEENERKRVPLIANLFRQFRTDNPLQVYFEIYNLIYDIAGKTHYTVQYMVNSQEPTNSEDRQIVSLRQEFVGESRFEPVTLAIDISQLPRGRTRLSILVEDLSVRETREKSYDFLIVE